MQAKTITASASGFMNFLRTLTGALATSLVTTSYQDSPPSAATGLSGRAGSSGEVALSMAGAGFAIRVVDPTTGSH
jgi:DHA2 family multidrug resistance protein